MSVSTRLPADGGTGAGGGQQPPDGPVLSITFPAGLVGLPGMKRFHLMDEGRSPWMCLRSLDEPHLAFTVVDPNHVCSAYHPAIDMDVLQATGADCVADLDLFVLAVEGPAGPETVNLLAPLAIDRRHRTGAQMVLDPASFPLRYPVRG